jgi:large subunit ribosomal protein L6
MSRVAKDPVPIPKGVDVQITGQRVQIKGSLGTLGRDFNPLVEMGVEGGVISVRPRIESRESWMQAGTARALLNNMVVGVSTGFSRKLDIIGVGYRAQAAGRKLNLSLGFSHPIDFPVEDGITIETPTQTEILVKGTDKQRVGQVAANIRAYRPPEPYKGKGIKYSDEVVIRKETKKGKK